MTFREKNMSDARYYVVGDDQVWVIRAKYANRVEAVVIAIDAAQKLGSRGECAHVCVVDQHGCFQSKWTYDRDRDLRRSVTGCNTLRTRRHETRLDLH
jgi:hypothetical protein